jgi:hypothetical protein
VANLDFENCGSDEELIRQLCESTGTNFGDELNDDKSKLRELFHETTRTGSTLNSTLRKSRKDFASRNSTKQNYRGPQSASPICMKRRHEDEQSSDSNEDMENELQDLNGENEYLENGSYETPQDIIENELETDSMTGSRTTAPYVEESDSNFPVGERDEDLRRLDLKELIYKLFLNIYNSEDQSIDRYKKYIFPKIDESTPLDNYITNAISSCMDHVKDELQSYIKKNLKYQKRKSDGHSKSMINDLTLVPFSEKIKDYNEIIDKIIDFYELFKCSIDNIVDVWKEKLGHIDKLYEV